MVTSTNRFRHFPTWDTTVTAAQGGLHGLSGVTINHGTISLSLYVIYDMVSTVNTRIRPSLSLTKFCLSRWHCLVFLKQYITWLRAVCIRWYWWQGIMSWVDQSSLIIPQKHYCLKKNIRNVSSNVNPMGLIGFKPVVRSLSHDCMILFLIYSHDSIYVYMETKAVCLYSYMHIASSMASAETI